MSEKERLYPNIANLGGNCLYWERKRGCIFPKFEMEGRRSCEGIIDDVCLYLKDRRIPKSLTEKQILELKIRPPTTNKSQIPPGDIKE